MRRAIPSLLDTLVVIAFVVPGFVAFSIARWLAVSERKLPEFETIVWSILISLAIYGVLGSATSISDFDSLRDKILLPGVLLAVVGFTILSGILIGLIWHLFANRGVRPEFGNPWDLFFDRLRKDGRDLVVFTSGGLEFKGWVGLSGKQDNRLELILEHPTLIARDGNGSVLSEMEYGERILFKDTDIKRIAVLARRQ